MFYEPNVWCLWWKYFVSYHRNKTGPTGHIMYTFISTGPNNCIWINNQYSSCDNKKSNGLWRSDVSSNIKLRALKLVVFEWTSWMSLMDRRCGSNYLDVCRTTRKTVQTTGKKVQTTRKMVHCTSVSFHCFYAQYEHMQHVWLLIAFKHLILTKLIRAVFNSIITKYPDNEPLLDFIKGIRFNSRINCMRKFTFCVFCGTQGWSFSFKIQNEDYTRTTNKFYLIWFVYFVQHNNGWRTMIIH